jgi:DNA-binding response OmpR family regulator
LNFFWGREVEKAQGLRFGDMVLDQTCLFALRNGRKIQFTRNERALLLALTQNPRRLMRRDRLLDEIASESDVSDRNIDFLVNRLRAKLGVAPDHRILSPHNMARVTSGSPFHLP